MSGWLRDGEVLEGQGSGQASPCNPRFRTPRSSPDSATFRSPRNTMRKAKELFGLCDKENKGFITKRDLQRLEGEVPLTPEQLESVFESLDRDRNGFLTPLEFHTGLGELIEECEEKDPAELRFTQILIELGADKILKDQWELCSLWCDLQKDRPELLNLLEEILSHAVAHLQDALKERDNLEETLHRREDEHNTVVRSLYEDLESQLKEERKKRITLDSARQGDKREQLLQELRTREQELEFTLTKQRELETRIKALCKDQASTRGQNQRLQLVNADLREQLEESREELQKALNQLQILQETLTDQQEGKQRQVLKVSKNMQKEKESLMRQLDLLRDMNKRLRDEKDAQQDQKRTPKMKRRLEKKGSIIGDYILAKRPSNRQVSFVGQMKSSPDVIADAELTLSEKNHKVDTYKKMTSLSGPQRVFKVVFLGSSGVGKSSFIHHYCRGHFPNKMSTTVGMDFQVRSLVLDCTQIALQLWDTAGQERFHSITTQYYRKADGILVMYDVTQSTSLVAVRDWLDQVQKHKADGACVILLGNKVDMEDGGGRQVTSMQGQKLAEEYQADFFECSAKSGHNIEEAMTHLARLMEAQQDKQCETVLHSLDNSSHSGHCCA
ncbi:EF-hand calcium-binding domain-containing protein 4A [Tachysurus fulvidraco]|uniref:EF-hand calcium-binding domain-containing protein 4A n=1 Tax=Tachysurus fulvidraco TaxID=1234273 RepID=UPI001FEFE48C|nr:EF-hand calcium-binding domain-containing protein 4A [Tachysurus fulvidraco]XP_047675648.1 EF-hand calcium-binding domain-containing protein 4A [Tachysurus fulvidraco]XP_047675649.1 EF-hand calcium-binding domain-containing protein 4A [Tachysurus fulvidraco]XP_047675650.1 EF-hand calcium-binding domain-containing protein 4A [Tachysurus fulvidraco]XP_047675651.1 EF-hand calcium-binding domain-containing protein 4A [Tachysurus fulvidraco]XP_047675652.1 EF-hand calcium-binding domain-containin